MPTNQNSWFTHRANIGHDPLIVKLIAIHGFEGYGRHMRLMEYMCGEQMTCVDLNDRFILPALADMLKWTQDQVKGFLLALVDIGLYTECDGKICCPMLCDAMKASLQRTEIARLAGAASAEAKRKSKEQKLAKKAARIAKKQLTAPEPPKEPEQASLPLDVPPAKNPPKPAEVNEFEGLSETDINNWTMFVAWIKKNDYKQVMGLQKPLTPQQYCRLLTNKKYTPQLIKDTFLSMENTKLLKKKYISASLTLQNWMNMAIERGAK